MLIIDIWVWIIIGCFTYNIITVLRSIGMNSLQTLKKQIQKLKQQKNPLLSELQSRVQHQQQTIKKLTQKLIVSEANTYTVSFAKLESNAYLWNGLRKGQEGHIGSATGDRQAGSGRSCNYVVVDVGVDPGKSFLFGTNVKLVKWQQFSKVLNNQVPQWQHSSSTESNPDVQSYRELEGQFVSLQETISGLKKQIRQLKHKYQSDMQSNVSVLNNNQNIQKQRQQFQNGVTLNAPEVLIKDVSFGSNETAANKKGEIVQEDGNYNQKIQEVNKVINEDQKHQKKESDKNIVQSTAKDESKNQHLNIEKVHNKKIEQQKDKQLNTSRQQQKNSKPTPNKSVPSNQPSLQPQQMAQKQQDKQEQKNEQIIPIQSNDTTSMVSVGGEQKKQLSAAVAKDDQQQTKELGYIMHSQQGIQLHRSDPSIQVLKKSSQENNGQKLEERQSGGKKQNKVYNKEVSMDQRLPYLSQISEVSQTDKSVVNPSTSQQKILSDSQKNDPLLQNATPINIQTKQPQQLAKIETKEKQQAQSQLKQESGQNLSKESVSDKNITNSNSDIPEEVTKTISIQKEIREQELKQQKQQKEQQEQKEKEQEKEQKNREVNKSIRKQVSEEEQKDTKVIQQKTSSQQKPIQQQNKQSPNQEPPQQPISPVVHPEQSDREKKKVTLQVSQDLNEMKRSKSGSKRSNKSGRKSDKKPDWSSLFPTFSSAAKDQRRSAKNDEPEKSKDARFSENKKQQTISQNKQPFRSQTSKQKINTEPIKQKESGMDTKKQQIGQTLAPLQMSNTVQKDEKVVPPPIDTNKSPVNRVEQSHQSNKESNILQKSENETSKSLTSAAQLTKTEFELPKQSSKEPVFINQSSQKPEIKLTNQEQDKQKKHEKRTEADKHTTGAAGLNWNSLFSTGQAKQKDKKMHTSKHEKKGEHKSHKKETEEKKVVKQDKKQEEKIKEQADNVADIVQKQKQPNENPIPINFQTPKKQQQNSVQQQNSLKQKQEAYTTPVWRLKSPEEEPQIQVQNKQNVGVDANFNESNNQKDISQSVSTEQKQQKRYSFKQKQQNEKKNEEKSEEANQEKKQVRIVDENIFLRVKSNQNNQAQLSEQEEIDDMLRQIQAQKQQKKQNNDSKTQNQTNKPQKQVQQTTNPLVSSIPKTSTPASQLPEQIPVPPQITIIKPSQVGPAQISQNSPSETSQIAQVASSQSAQNAQQQTAQKPQIEIDMWQNRKPTPVGSQLQLPLQNKCELSEEQEIDDMLKQIEQQDQVKKLVQIDKWENRKNRKKGQNSQEPKGTKEGNELKGLELLTVQDMAYQGEISQEEEIDDMMKDIDEEKKKKKQVKIDTWENRPKKKKQVDPNLLQVQQIQNYCQLSEQEEIDDMLKQIQEQDKKQKDITQKKEQKENKVQAGQTSKKTNQNQNKKQKNQSQQIDEMLKQIQEQQRIQKQNRKKQQQKAVSTQQEQSKIGQEHKKLQNELDLNSQIKSLFNFGTERKPERKQSMKSSRKKSESSKKQQNKPVIQPSGFIVHQDPSSDLRKEDTKNQSKLESSVKFDEFLAASVDFSDKSDKNNDAKSPQTKDLIKEDKEDKKDEETKNVRQNLNNLQLKDKRFSGQLKDGENLAGFEQISPIAKSTQKQSQPRKRKPTLESLHKQSQPSIQHFPIMPQDETESPDIKTPYPNSQIISSKQKIASSRKLQQYKIELTEIENQNKEKDINKQKEKEKEKEKMEDNKVEKKQEVENNQQLSQKSNDVVKEKPVQEKKKPVSKILYFRKG